MNYPKIKIIVCVLWLIGVFVIVTTKKSMTVSANDFDIMSEISKPDSKAVETFNLLIQTRFLTESGFGGARIQPNPPHSNHLSSFYPKDELEKKAVKDFERNGWKVGLYLFGKTAGRKVKNGVEQKEFLIEYRFKQPVIITKNIKNREELSHSNRILKQVKESFSQFQASEENQEKDFKFNTGGWWYFAKPVRAVNQSCVSCHADYVVVKKLEDGKYQFRTRKIGDVNGILVYGFKKVK